MEKLHEYFPVIEAALNANMAFSVHWESLNDSKGRELCEQDREEAAIPFLDKVAKTFPRLRMVVEHATTKKMIDYVKQASLYIRATLTIHHALLTFTDVCLEPGIIYRPHSYCKPIAKKEDDRQAVVKAMVSGDRHFFFGSDLAPHPTEAKQRHPPAAGIFCPGEIATPLMVEVFLANNALKRVDDFRARFGAEFYNLPPETGSLELFRKDWNIPGEYGGIVPFLSGSPLRWKIAE
jgi:dihydroorotase